MKAPLTFDCPSTSSTCPLDGLLIPGHLKNFLWDKSRELVDEECAIVQAPGDENGWMVKSVSGKRPHYVRKSKSSFACDDQCLSYKSVKICSHTIALAVKTHCLDTFLKWCGTLKCSRNFTLLAETGKPASAGKKPNRKGVLKKCSEPIK